MKQRLRYLLGLGVITAVLVASPVVFAETGTNSNSGNTGSTPAQPPTTGSTSDDNGTDQPLTSTQKTEMENRLSKLKTDLKIKLATADLNKLKLKCQPAQGVIKDVDSRVKTNVPVRVKAYTELNDKLTSVITKLKDKNIDTTELQQEQTVLVAKIATFNTDLTAFKQTVSDARNVDCVADPTAFKAALETARTARDKVIKDMTDIKTYVTTTIKPTLQTIRQQLDAEEKKSDNSTEKTGSN